MGYVVGRMHRDCLSGPMLNHDNISLGTNLPPPGVGSS